MGIGARLKEIIDDRGTNVNQIAKQTDTSPMTIYSIIKRDNTKVDIEILLKICKALNVSVEDIYQPNFKANSNANISKTTQTTSEDTITPHERELINAYREQPESVKIAICKMLDVEIEIPQKTVIFRAASSDDNHPAEIVETDIDFSKIPTTDIDL